MMETRGVGGVAAASGARGQWSCLVLLLAAVLACTRVANAGHAAAPPVLTIEAESLKALLDQGVRPVSVDLRSAMEHRSGRLPGARSIPLDELERRWAEVPRDQMVVLYCVCPAPTLALAYNFLRRQGYRHLYVLEDGVGAWAARGYPLER